MTPILRWCLLVIALLMGYSVGAVSIGATPSGTMNVRTPAVKDFHGHLVGPSGTITEPDGPSPRTPW